MGPQYAEYFCILFWAQAPFAIGHYKESLTLDAKKKTVGATINEEKHPDLVEPFSEREFEVLRLFVTDLWPAEVAKKLVLICNTFAKIGERK